MSEKDHSADDGAPVGARPAVAAVVVVLLLVLLVLAAAATGPWEREPFPEVEPASPATPSIEPEPSGLEPETVTMPPPQQGGGQPGVVALTWALVGLLLAILVVLLLFALRYLAAQRRRRRPAEIAHVIQPGAEEPEVDEPAMRDGIAHARRILDSDRPPRDAIVEAWLVLEQAAVAAGVGRTPAQTPTEFTAVVLDRTPAQRDAVDVLRDLYERVRFSDQPVAAADGDAARAAISAIAEHWSAMAAGR